MIRTKKELYQEVRENEVLIDNMNKQLSTYEKALNTKNEEIRLLKLEVKAAKETEKEWRILCNEKTIECNEWRKLNASLTEQLVEVRAKLEVAKIPF